MPNYPYNTLNVQLSIDNLNKLNDNFVNIETDIKEANDRISEIVAQAGSDNTEIVDARGGFPVLSDRLNDTDTRLDQGFASVRDDVFDYTLTPQSPKPQKNGIRTNSAKIIQKTSADELQIVQRTNKGYVHYTLTKNSGASGTEDYGINHELIRLTKARQFQDAYVYFDMGSPASGTLTTLYEAGQNNTIEQRLFKLPQLDMSRNFSSKGDGTGLACYELATGGEVTYNLDATKTKKANILFLCSTGGGEDVQILINDTLVKSFNPRSYVVTGTTTAAMALIEFEIPSKADGDEIIVLKIKNNSSSYPVYPCCINFFELKDHNGQVIDNFKCFGSTRGGWIENSGASDYALYDATAGKWFGSYHGGEVSEHDFLIWNKNAITDIDEYDLSMTAFADVPTGEWRIQRNFKLYQQTALAGGKARMVSEFDFNVDGTLEMDFGYYDGQVQLGTFYTGLTSTNTAFSYVFQPKFHFFGDVPSGNHYNIPLTEGRISQVNPTDVLQLDIRFTKFNQEHDTRGPSIFDHDNYRKFYYGPIFGAASNPVSLGSLSFSKGLDFIVR
ncbi:hypothetical protein P4284_15990 [Bacillus swezeyi]|uniref:hypothetical protein n=1 Tax=Bacillus swezeyi TaxID=1925020 RepID=UPI0027DBA173|nr:hypothetical protein [Bacillus swezeyi]MED2978188.1 hypothetical protein [Bacillus swezeyi]